MRAGEVVAGRYEIQALAGAGGMGAVYRARDRESGETVALKLVQAGPSDVARFAREAEVLASLSHPGIVRYLGHGRAEGGELYLAMEWLEGEDLAARLRRAPFSVADTLTLGRAAAEALAYAHARGVIHRDIKPHNMFLAGGRADRVKIIDFGVARAGAGAADLTRLGMAVGTPGYMAPEQARGDEDVDARADVFSLGCALFECLTGRPAFVGDHPLALLAKILLEELPRVRELSPEVPATLAALVERMMARDRAARPEGAAAVARELSAIDAAAPGEGGPASIDAPSLTGGEQRMICILLARPTAGAPPPEYAHAEVPQGELAAVAEQHGGRLERLVDGSLAVLLSGVRNAIDQAAQAARCALALRAALPDAPMALATGRALVGRRWPVGEAIERAARLLRDEPRAPSTVAGEPSPAPSPPRDVRIDEVTAGLLGARFEVRGDGGGLSLGGERDPGGGERRLLGRATPCLGRDREIGVLLGLFEQCVEDGVARAALVTGPPGIGKSRVAAELTARLRERGDALEIWIGRGDPISAGSPFGLLGAALRRAAGIAEGEPAALRRQKLRARVGRHVPPKELARVAAFLGELTGAAFPEEESIELRAARRSAVLLNDQMRRAFEDLLAAEAAAQPVLIVLEDLHWGDLPSVSFLDAALRNVGERPWMVLGLGRPEVAEVFPRLWRDRSLEEIRLSGLGKKAAERLVRHVLGDAAPEGAIARVVDRAAGNAFYLEELIRAVAEGQADRLPETVLAVVEARLDALREEERRALRAASVFGQVFWQRGVERLLGEAAAPGVRGALAALAEREIIAPSQGSRFPGEAEHAFRHALLREAAYATLTDADRALGHRLAGAYLEEVGEAEALTLAEHHERGRDPARAAAFYRRAAEQARAGNDFAAVLARAERGVALGAAGQALGALRLLQAEAHTWRGEHALAEARGLEALEALPEGSASWCDAAGEVVIAGGRLGNHEVLVRISERLHALPAPSAADAASAHLIAMARASMQLFVCGHYDLAGRLVDRIEAADLLRAARVADDPVTLGRMEQARAFRAHFSGDARSYLEHLLAAAASFDRAGDLRNACVQRGNVGHAYLALGDFAAAERALVEAGPAAERMGLSHIATVAKHNLGLALARLGRVDEARKVEAEARAAFAAQGDVRLEAAARTYLALIELAAGDAAAAEREARGAVEMAAASPPLLAYALGTLARALLEAGRAQEALGEAGAAMKILGELGGIDEGEELVREAYEDAVRAAGAAVEGAVVEGSAAVPD